MRRLIVLAAACGLLALGAEAAPSAPPRKVGLWSQTFSSPPNKVMTIKTCVDAATNARISVLGPQFSACASQAMTPISAGWSFQTVCGGKTIVSGTVIGDLKANYTVKAGETTTGAPPSGNGPSRWTMTATWKGACPAGMKGGDFVMPNGMKVNLLQMTGAYF